MTNKKFKFTGDRLNATFRHEIYLENGKVLDGYSKHQNHDEPKDREKCLVGVVQRIITNGYIAKSQYIAFYTNEKLGKDRDTLLVELTPQSVTIHGEAETMFDLINYLDKVYKALLSGQNFEEIKPLSRKSFSPDMFKISGQFATKSDLTKYCESLQKQGVPQGRVQGFYYAYLRVYPSLNEAETARNNAPTVSPETMIGARLAHFKVS